VAKSNQMQSALKIQENVTKTTEAHNNGNNHKQSKARKAKKQTFSVDMQSQLSFRGYRKLGG